MTFRFFVDLVVLFFLSLLLDAIFPKSASWPQVSYIEQSKLKAQAQAQAQVQERGDQKYGIKHFPKKKPVLWHRSQLSSSSNKNPSPNPVQERKSIVRDENPRKTPPLSSPFVSPLALFLPSSFDQIVCPFVNQINQSLRPNYALSFQFVSMPYA